MGGAVHAPIKARTAPGGSFDAVLCVGFGDAVELSPVLPFLKRGGAVLLAAMYAPSLSVEPRLLQERQLMLRAATALSHKEMSAMLAFCTRKRIRPEQTQAEMSAESMNEALDALARASEQVPHATE